MSTKNNKAKIKELYSQLTSLKVKKIRAEFQYKQELKKLETISRVLLAATLISGFMLVMSLSKFIQVKEFRHYEDNSGRITLTYCIPFALCDQSKDTKGV